MRSRILVIALLAAAYLVPAADASARRIRGHEVFENPHHKVAISNARARRLTRRALNHRFLVARGTEQYACSPHSFGESGCDFAFTGDVTGRDYCGNAVVRASRRSVIVRFVAFDRGCGDF